MIAIKPVMKSILVAAALSATGWAAAQSSAPSSPAKKDLVQRLLVVQQPSFDGLAQQTATRPIAELGNKVQAILLASVPPEKREATARQIEPYLKKLAEDAVPMVKEATTKNAPTVYGAAIEEKFTEDELRQLVTFLESPVRKKFEQANPELYQALAKKSLDDIREKIDPKLQATLQATQKILDGVVERPKEAKPAGKPASKAASKAQ
ncbi:MAG: DUF2059 domain-containing protein [Aquabacterium sp.]|jgi:hypothetical protein|nr:MAG: DUF2059 domain-containing protein [Aquabacterium sp.]TAL24943.1 MAG: DUF2059 domain-containing protein [Aquabacterium sp.]